MTRRKSPSDEPSTPSSERFTVAGLVRSVVGPNLAAGGQVPGHTGPAVDLLITHDIVNRNALRKRAERGRFAEHSSNPMNPSNPKVVSGPVYAAAR